MLKDLIWVIMFVADLIFLRLPQFIKLSFLELTATEEKVRAYANQVAYQWGEKVVETTGSEVKVLGVKKIPDQPVLFVANHQGAFDIPLLLGYIKQPKSFIAKWELRYLPVINLWMKKIKCIFIKRSDFRQTLRAFKNAGQVFETGQSLVIFPEGTRSRSAKLNKFKRGSLKIALRENVPIVPVTINNSYQINNGEEGLLSATEVELIISDPIYVDELSKEEKDDLTVQVREVIAENLKK
ncbi:1-acyl-sn-glycerol-3-phosphate acyltransferase [Natroniella sulfidigena]|uniref:lysophospholipid acyltransferase family protein n=1 Tax=Natroniella sulfidigena TaxID=723921 RepID=UPI00200B89A6|nr:lysophospholipid acyltransferase family protein [Natroniella sulfidigena]MCK8816262.1 1-acyl-sn-glycerol-3-phosphate acyltransferase [Natroniella sulfidigena]